MPLLQAAVIGLIALILTPGLLFYFDVTAKVAVLLAGAAVAVFATRRAPRWWAAVVLANLVSLGISVAASPNPGLALYGTNWRRFGAVTQAAVWIFAWSIACGKSPTRTILRGVTIVTAVAAIYGIAQYSGWDPLLPSAAYHIGEGVWTIVRPPGTMGYVSYSATWLAIAAFLALAQLEFETGVWWRRFAWATAAVAVLAMCLTGTRAAMAGTAAGLLVWLYRRGWRVTRKIAVIAGLLAMAGMAFYFSPAGSQLRSRSRWFAEDPWGGGRLTLWRDTLRMAASRPVTGYGPDVFTGVFPAFESKSLARKYPDFAWESPHNVFLDALVSQGAIGLAIFALVICAGFRAAWRMKSPWLVAALTAGLVSQQFTVFTVPTAVLFFTVIALALASEEKPQPVPWRLPALAAAAMSLPLLYCAVRLILADYALENAKLAVDAGQPRVAGIQMARYRRLKLPGSSADLWYSRAMLSLATRLADPSARMEAVIASGAAAVEATRTSEEPFNPWFNLAIEDATRNDPAAAERSLRSAIRSRPNWFKPHWKLAQLLQLEARIPEALQEATLAADLDGAKHPEVFRTLDEIRRVPPLQK